MQQRQQHFCYWLRGASPKGVEGKERCIVVVVAVIRSTQLSRGTGQSAASAKRGAKRRFRSLAHSVTSRRYQPTVTVAGELHYPWHRPSLCLRLRASLAAVATADVVVYALIFRASGLFRETSAKKTARPFQGRERIARLQEEEKSKANRKASRVAKAVTVPLGSTSVGKQANRS